MLVLKFRDGDGEVGALLIVESIERLPISVAHLASLMPLLDAESKALLERIRLRHHTTSYDHSQRVKRGIQAAKGRGQQDGEKPS